MVEAEGAFRIGQQRCVESQRLRSVPALAGPMGQVVSRHQGVGMIGAERVLNSSHPRGPHVEVLTRYRTASSVENDGHLFAMAAVPRVLSFGDRRVGMDRVTVVIC